LLEKGANDNAFRQRSQDRGKPVAIQLHALKSVARLLEIVRGYEQARAEASDRFRLETRQAAD
jgi:hypothetical protein